MGRKKMAARKSMLLLLMLLSILAACGPGMMPVATETLPPTAAVSVSPTVTVPRIPDLEDLGPEHAPDLIALLGHESAEVRQSAANALMELALLVGLESLTEIGPEIRAEVPPLIEALGDESAEVRWAAATALGSVGVEAAEAVPALIDTLQDSDPQVRGSVAWALGRIGPEAAEAVPALIEALKDDDLYVRMRAADALGLIGPAAATAVPALIDSLSDESPMVRLASAWALSELGSPSPEAIAALVAALDDESPDVAEAAAESLKVLLWPPTLQASGWEGATLRTLCLEQELMFPGDAVEREVADLVERILTGLGLQLMSGGELCDATLKTAMTGEALGGYYSGPESEPGGNIGFCYPGAEISGAITLSAAGREAVSFPLSGRIDAPAMLVECRWPLPADAPFPWPTLLIDGLTQIWGPPGLIQALAHTGPDTP